MGTASLRLRVIREALTAKEWARVGGMVATIITLWVVGFTMLGAAAPHHYRMSANEIFGFGTGILAFTLGMRHAFDADHIAAIDNTTRKLITRGQAPAQRRLLLLPRALDDRLRLRCS